MSLSRAAAVLLLLLPLSAFAETPLEVYPGAPHVRIGNDIQINGELFRMAYFTTPDDPDKVARYFLEKWTDEGLPTFLDRTPDEQDLIVSAFYTREGLMRSIVLRRHDEQTTLGFTVLKDLWTKVDRPDRKGLVKLEGALFASDVSYSDGPGGAAQRQIIIEKPLSDVYQDVRARLSQSGFTISRESGQKVEGKQQVILEYARKGEQVVSILTAVEPTLTTVSQTSIGSDRPDMMPNDDAVRQAKQRYEEEKAKERRK